MITWTKKHIARNYGGGRILTISAQYARMLNSTLYGGTRTFIKLDYNKRGRLRRVVKIRNIENKINPPYTYKLWNQVV